MKNKYHFIAIGGIGMSGLAKYLLENGFEVSGSDVVDSKYIDKLRKLNAQVFIGHKKEHVPQDCVVVASTAIRDNNPEIIRAKELGLPIYHRSDILAQISSAGKFFLGYCGMHGKTTTSGLSAYVLEKAGYKPSYVVGGILPEIGTNAHCQDGKFFCAELDESDGTIVKYSPDVVVINNLEPDHLDFYKNGMKSILETFNKFISNLKPTALIVANIDNDGVKELVKDKNVVTYGLNQADYVAKNIEYTEDYTCFDIYYKNEFLTDMRIYMRGLHSVYNSLAVFASLHLSGVDIELIKPHFATFTGMGRRFEKIGEFDDITIYDDYAHHPTEIKATLSCAKSFKNKKIVAVFQPHRFTRLKTLWNEFLASFDDADRVIVTDIFTASEDPIEGITSENFVKQLKNGEHISGSMSDVAKKLLPTLTRNDIVIGLGAGTITDLGKELLKLNEEISKVGK